MKRHINHPYKVNWSMYALICAVSVCVMTAAVVCNVRTGSILSDVCKNLAFGCVASTIVALLIEIGNVKEKNEKANRVYDAVYSDLKLQLRWYVQTWARLCKVAYKDEDFAAQKHKWTEWYAIARDKFQLCDDSRKAELLYFYRGELQYAMESLAKALEQIKQQQYMLNINDIYDEELKWILADYTFEVRAAQTTLEGDGDQADFWNAFDAINQDFVNYIAKWVDVRYYNAYAFRPYEFLDDKAELTRAILKSDAKNDENSRVSKENN